MNEHLLFDVKDHVATLTLNRPELLNALSPLMRQGMIEALDRVDQDDDIWFAVITGAGKAFCAGGDLKKMKDDNEKNLSVEERVETYRGSTKVVKRLYETKKPLIAAINGHAVGAGLSLAILCDIRISTDRAKFGVPFAKRGLIPDWGATYLLPRIAGVSRAMELAASGRIFLADEARSMGIVNHVVKSEEFDSFLEQYLAELRQSSPLSLKLLKKAMRSSMNSDLLDALSVEEWLQGYCYASEEHKEGINAFIEKRPADYSKCRK